MKPNEETVTALAGLLGSQKDNLILDFAESFPEEKFGDVSQSIRNMMFVAFVAGTRVLMDPKSNFNKNYNFSKKPV